MNGQNFGVFCDEKNEWYTARMIKIKIMVKKQDKNEHAFKYGQDGAM